MQDTITTSQLTEKQELFVDLYVRSGGKVGLSAERAGYADRSIGSKLLRDPKVIKRIQELTLEALGTHAVHALHTVAKLSKSARSDYVRLEAAKDLLDRAGYKPPERVDHRVSADLSVSFDITPSQPVVDVTPDSDPTAGGG